MQSVAPNTTCHIGVPRQAGCKRFFRGEKLAFGYLAGRAETVWSGVLSGWYTPKLQGITEGPNLFGALTFVGIQSTLVHLVRSRSRLLFSDLIESLAKDS